MNIHPLILPFHSFKSLWLSTDVLRQAVWRELWFQWGRKWHQPIKLPVFRDKSLPEQRGTYANGAGPLSFIAERIRDVLDQNPFINVELREVGPRFLFFSLRVQSLSGTERITWRAACVPTRESENKYMGWKLYKLREGNVQLQFRDGDEVDWGEVRIHVKSELAVYWACCTVMSLMGTRQGEDQERFHLAREQTQFSGTTAQNFASRFSVACFE